MKKRGDSRTPRSAGGSATTTRGSMFGWTYLAITSLLLVLAIGIWGREGSQASASRIDLGGTDRVTTTAVAELTPARIAVAVDRKIVTITGTVPDEGARSQMVRIAEDRFGNGNVIDELEIDPGVDLATGTIHFSGIGDEGDDAAIELRENAAADLGVAIGTFDVEFVRPRFEPANVQVALGAEPIVVTGTVPSESDRDRLLQSVEAVYGEGQVDVTGVVIEPSDLEGASFTLAGLTEPGDTRSDSLVEILQTDFRTVLVADDSEVDQSDAALQALEERLVATLIDNPILFIPGSSEISEEGARNLIVVADTILAVPERGVEIIGHTDDTGGETLNQLLSERRAESVKAALVELGVSEARLQTEGAGSSRPAVPNFNAENRARNRRIEFLFARG